MTTLNIRFKNTTVWHDDPNCPQCFHCDGCGENPCICLDKAGGCKCHLVTPDMVDSPHFLSWGWCFLPYKEMKTRATLNSILAAIGNDFDFIVSYRFLEDGEIDVLEWMEHTKACLRMHAQQLENEPQSIGSYDPCYIMLDYQTIGGVEVF